MACLKRLLAISPAEERVLALLLQGHGNRSIAARLGLSPRTVESHLAAMFEKTGCRNRSQLLLWGLTQPTVPAWNGTHALASARGAGGIQGDSAQCRTAGSGGSLSQPPCSAGSTPAASDCQSGPD